MNKDKKVVIVDYRLGNMFSVYHACNYFGAKPLISSNREDILNADYLILPGMGAFGDAMKTLEELKIVDSLHAFVDSGKPFLGVCLGLQLLFSESEEFGLNKGLGIIEGVVRRFTAKDTAGNKLKVPQIEWNQIFSLDEKKWMNSPFKDLNNGEYMYFVHSYYVIPQNQDDCLSITEYGELKYCSSVIKKNVFACQFHPEKSGKQGLSIYKNFLNQ